MTITPNGYDNHYVSYSYGLTYDAEITDEPASPSVEIVTKDGSEIPLNHPWSLGAVIKPDKDYEVAIFTDYFEALVDPNNIAGIILDGVYYVF